MDFALEVSVLLKMDRFSASLASRLMRSRMQMGSSCETLFVALNHRMKMRSRHSQTGFFLSVLLPWKMGRSEDSHR